MVAMPDCSLPKLVRLLQLYNMWNAPADDGPGDFWNEVAAASHG